MAPLPTPARVVADLAACLRFFSRVPVPRLGALDDPAALPDFSRAAALVPLAGVILVLPAALLGLLLGATALPAAITGAVAVAAAALLTGAIHEDGLADTADGLGGGADRARRLAIMKDSRIGVFGAAALVLALLVRVVAWGTLFDGADGATLLAGAGAVLAAAAASRSAMVVVWHRLPAARSDGLAAAAGRPGGPATVVAVVLGLALAAAAIPAAGPAGVATGLLLATLAAAALAATARRAIGGQTGDVLGAVQQVAEIALLVGLLL